jgi:glycosyltransferase involved in cell wall biosynthesis
MNSLKDKKILVVSYYGYPPITGDEYYLLDTMSWCANYGMSVRLLTGVHPVEDLASYQIVHPTKLHTQLNNEIQTYYGNIRFTSFDYESLKKNIQEWSPDIVHQIGIQKEMILAICNELHIKTICATCYWSDFIDCTQFLNLIDPLNPLNSENCASNISLVDPISYSSRGPTRFNNSTKATPQRHSLFNQLATYADEIYATSEYTQKALKKICSYDPKYIVYSSSSVENALVEYPLNKNGIQYVTFITCQVIKGLNLIIEIIKRARDVPFLIIDSYAPDDISEIENEIAYRKTIPDAQPIIFLREKQMIKTVLAHTSILLLPSLVDETFSRLCNEAMMNGIPVITTGKGNLSYMLEDTGIIHQTLDPEIWIGSICELLHNPSHYKELSTKSQIRYNLFSERVASGQLMKLILDVLSRDYAHEYKLTRTLMNTNEKNILFFTVWGDQGLGIQCKTYVKALEEINKIYHQKYKSFIYSYASYYTAPGYIYQEDPSEWTHPNVFYANEVREDTNYELLIKYIMKNMITHMIIPEVTTDIIKLASFIKQTLPDLLIYAIPNIEWMKKTDLELINIFDLVITNNKFTSDLLRAQIECQIPQTQDFCQNKIKYLGYYPLNMRYTKQNKVFGNKIKFIYLIGRNTPEDSNLLDICSAFRVARSINKYIELYIYTQYVGEDAGLINLSLAHYINIPGLYIINKKMSNEETLDRYLDSDANIILTSAEGLGLGIYESLVLDLPTLAIDTPPFNEVLPSKYLVKRKEKMSEIEDLCKRYGADPLDLVEKILNCADDLMRSDKTSNNTSNNASDNTSNNASDNVSNNASDNVSNNASDNTSNNASDNVSDNVSNNASNNASDNVSNNASDNVSNNASDNTSNNASNNASDNVSNNASNNASDNVSNNASDNTSNNASNNASDNVSNNASDNISNNASDNTSNNASDNVSNNASNNASDNVSNNASDNTSNNTSHNASDNTSNNASDNVSDNVSNNASDNASDNASMCLDNLREFLDRFLMILSE